VPSVVVIPVAFGIVNAVPKVGAEPFVIFNVPVEATTSAFVALPTPVTFGTVKAVPVFKVAVFKNLTVLVTLNSGQAPAAIPNYFHAGVELVISNTL